MGKRTHLSHQTRCNMGPDWMGLLDNDTPLSMLTIPGTHDSAAFTNSVPFIATQKMDILDQLNAGIRYFDLRCGLRDDIVEMVHGPSYLGLTLQMVLETMYLWLEVNPSEALIVQIKKDRNEERATVEFSDALIAVLAQKPERWRTASTVPLLGALRGRIQLFRRFEGRGLHGYGLNVNEWKDNPHKPFTIFARHGVRVTIQDHYTFPKPQPLPTVIMKKGGVVFMLMKRASSNREENHWFINFTSAYEFNLRYQLTPHEIAVGGYHRFKWEDGMNVRLRGSLIANGGKRTRFGIVAMDFPEIGTDDLIPALIQSNFDLEDYRRWNFCAIWSFLLILIALILAVVWVVNRIPLDIGQKSQIMQDGRPLQSIIPESIQRILLAVQSS